VPKRAAIHLRQVSLDNRPPSCLVLVERLAGIGVELDQALVRETGLLQAERLPTSPAHSSTEVSCSMALSAPVSGMTVIVERTRVRRSLAGCPRCRSSSDWPR